ncbi:MAG TPA: hypothetical protein VEB21_06130 [Terriglobales bacterium]|nr:hypothetical protein [Terriglobales bacterium]
MLASSAAAQLVSVGLNGTTQVGTSQGAATNLDGSVVAFASDANQLVVGDTNQVRDVFVRTIGGSTERVSVSSEGAQANRGSQVAGGAPSLDATATTVAFYSDASNLVAGDSNGQTDVFLRDLDADTTTLVSVAADGGAANGPSLFPSLSADGRLVAFQSQASNLVEGDTNGAADIFVRDLEAGTTVRACNVQGNRFSFTPALSDDGTVVAFASASTDLVDGDTNGFVDIFICDLTTGTIELISSGGNGDSILPAINADGRFVTFKSLANNLVPDDRNGVVDVFLRDRQSGSIERISVDRFGGNAEDFSFPPSISDDGRFVAFGSAATDLIEFDTNNASDVFVRDRQIGVTLLVSRAANGQQADGGTPDQPPSISGDGMVIAYASAAANLADNDRNMAIDVFRAQNPFFGPGSCPDGTCPDEQVCVQGFCQAPTVTPTATRTPPPSNTPTQTNTATPTPTFRPCEVDADCPEGQHCRGGFCRVERPCDLEDPGVDLLACFERETCIGNLCECGGDCNLDGYVLGSEITRATLVLAGARPVEDCRSADIDLDGNVMGNEITLAIINLDEGCLQEGRPLIFAHDRGETVNISVQSNIDVATGKADVTVDLSGSKNEVATVQLDLLFDPAMLAIGDPASSCVKSSRLGDQVLVASLPNSPAAPEGTDRLRLFLGSVSAPVGSFGDGNVLTCSFDLKASGGETLLRPERLNVGDARGNTFRVVADDGNVILPTPTPAPETEPAPVCPGDCDRDGAVMGNEITQAIRIMIGDAEMVECVSADADRDGLVFVTDITRAVINMGLGCPQ